jgi:uncharacterized protein (TIGR02246 family)
MPDSSPIAQSLAAALETAWNAADGTAFAALFAQDADFVDIRADYHKGRPAIVAGHQALFESIDRGSRIEYRLIQAREIASGLTLAHVAATLNAPGGPMAGTNKSTYSILIGGSGETARIAAFQNTLVPPGG